MVDHIGGDRIINPASVPGQKSPKSEPVKQKQGTSSFAETLEKAQKSQEKQDLKISAHARERMEQRQINLGEEELQQISDAVERAEDKGARSSLLLYGDVALVASVDNRTIVTAVDGDESREHIFTGIDSAVIVK